MSLFHLSILQLLVAMAVMAGFVAVNQVVFPPPPFELLAGSQSDLCARCMGWPLAYYDAIGLYDLDSKTDVPKFYAFGHSDYRWWSLVGNIAIGTVTVVVVLLGVGAIQRRTAMSRSPS